MQFAVLLAVTILAFIALYIKASHLSNAPSNSEPLELLAFFLSNKNRGVVEEVRLYLTSPKAYFEKHEKNLYQRGIESAEEVTGPVVLIDALLAQEKIVYQDHKAEPSDVLLMLNRLSEGKFEMGAGYNDLAELYKRSEFGISKYLELSQAAPSIFGFSRSVGLELLSIDEDSDSYALVLIESNELDRFMDVAQEAGIKINFSEK
jgi:hypothetical protein